MERTRAKRKVKLCVKIRRNKVASIRAQNQREKKWKRRKRFYSEIRLSKDNDLVNKINS